MRRPWQAQHSPRPGPFARQPGTCQPLGVAGGGARRRRGSGHHRPRTQIADLSRREPGCHRALPCRGRWAQCGLLRL